MDLQIEARFAISSHRVRCRIILWMEALEMQSLHRSQFLVEALSFGLQLIKSELSMFNSADGTKAILIDVTSASGLSKDSRLQHYTPGAVAELAEQKSEGICKAVEHGRGKGQAHLLCDRVVRLSRTRGTRPLSGNDRGRRGRTRGAQIHLRKSLHNRALRIEHTMEPRLYGGLGLGVEEVRGR
jgi:hypothetical protein